ncbi:hypothetical protein [Halorubrum tailed virus BLv36]|nr:hypothetical protein [Halorubrum tailed virus BLv36]
MSGLSDKARTVLETLPADKYELAEAINQKPTTAKDKIQELRQHDYDIEYDLSTQKYHQAENDPYNKAEEIVEPVRDSIENGAHESELLETLQTTSEQLTAALDRLESEGVNIRTMGDEKDPVYHIPTEWDQKYTLNQGGEKLTFALISDTHLGSSAEHLDELHDFYDRCVNQGITDVFHCGDISDGWKVHPGHLNEIKPDAAGWQRLKNYVVENYPQRENITTHFIEGNHDNKFYNRNNIHFGRLIADRRDDLNYLGNSQATIYLSREHDITLELIHPSGGKPYTTGYRLQTLYRERNMEDRPTIGGVGHLHGSMYAETEGVKGLYAGAWKGTTTYGKRKGHQAKIGGWILDVTISDGEITEFVPKWQGYPERETDNEYDLEELDK